MNTDLIYPGKYLSITEPKDMAKYALAGLDLEFGSKVKSGDIIVADENFGSGSSRDQAAICLKYAKVSAVIAVSFSRIFYRNVINQGIFGLISPEAVNIIKHKDTVEVDLNNEVVTNLSTGQVCKFQTIPDFLLEIISAGGLIPHLKEKMRT